MAEISSLTYKRGNVSNLDTFLLLHWLTKLHLDSPQAGGYNNSVPRRREHLGGILLPRQAVFELVEWFYFRAE